MSQAKVDRYKEEKRNRAKIMAKEKRQARIMKACAGVLGAAIIVWAGYSVYDTLTRKPAADTTPTEIQSLTINSDALSEYLNGLDAD